MSELYWFIVFLFSAVGGLGLVLVGLRHLSESFQAIFHSTIIKLVSALSKNALMCIFIGGFTAFFVQSGLSAATAFISYSTAGLLGFEQATALILGSNLGTVATLWLFLVKIDFLDLYLLGIGVLPMLYARQSTISSIGKLFFSLGLIFLGFRLFSSGVPDASVIQFYIPKIFTQNGWSFLSFVMVGLSSVVAAFLVRSSLALLALIMGAISSGVIDGYTGLAFVFSINMGVSLLPFIDSFEANTLGKRTALFHFLSNFISLIVAIIFFDSIFESLNQLLNFYGLNLVYLVPMSHTIFNVLLVVVFGTLLIPLRNFSRKIIRDKSEKEAQRLIFLGRNSNLAPSLAIEQAFLEVKKLAAMVETILHLTNKAITLDEAHEEIVDKILKYEEITDSIRSEIEEFLSHVIEIRLTSRQSTQVKHLMQMSNELEAMADSCQTIFENFKVLQEHSEEEAEQVGKFSRDLFDVVLSHYELVFSMIAESGSPLTSKLDEKIILDYVDNDPTSKKSYLEINRILAQKESMASYAFNEVFMSLRTIKKQTARVFESYKSWCES